MFNSLSLHVASHLMSFHSSSYHSPFLHVTSCCLTFTSLSIRNRQTESTSVAVQFLSFHRQARQAQMQKIAATRAGNCPTRLSRLQTGQARVNKSSACTGTCAGAKTLLRAGPQQPNKTAQNLRTAYQNLNQRFNSPHKKELITTHASVSTLRRADATCSCHGMRKQNAL